MNALGRLELYAVLRQRWFVGTLLLSAGIVGFFTLIAARESVVLGFTGFGRVMGGVVQAALLLLPLLSLLSTTQAITTARQAGVLEWYMTQPVSRGECFRALLLPRLAAIVGPVVGAVALLGLAAAATGTPVAPGLMVAFLLLLSGQGFCFASIGLWISATAKSPEQALLRAIGVWMAGAVLVDFVVLGLMLQWELPPSLVFVLAGLNPMQAGRVGMLAAIDAELGALGPVGTWASLKLGPALTEGIGLGHAWGVGFISLGMAWQAFRRNDLL